MIKMDEKAIMLAVISELEKLSLFLDTELDVTANMPIEEIENDLRTMGLDPNQRFPSKIRQLIFEKAREHQAHDTSSDAGERAHSEAPRTGRGNWPFHVYISNEPLLNECSDEVKFLILEIRHLARQQRYEEALYLAGKATSLAPNYWRAWITLATLSVLFGKVDEGDEIFEQVSRDFPDNPKAVAAGLHGRAWVKEIRYAAVENPTADVLREVLALYERALQLDGLRDNSRACLLIQQLQSGETDKGQKLAEDSLLFEGFLDALQFELDKRRSSENRAHRARAYKAQHALPAWLNYLLRPINPTRAEGYGY